MVRPVDKMGRVVIPKEIRKALEIENNRDCFEIYTEGNRVILKKYQPSCIFCDSVGESVSYGGYTVCLDCIDKMTKAKEDFIEEFGEMVGLK